MSEAHSSKQASEPYIYTEEEDRKRIFWRRVLIGLAVAQFALFAVALVFQDYIV